MMPALSLRSKITYIFSVIAVMVLAGGGSLFWYTFQTDRSIVMMIDREIFLYKAVQDMELALANQKGFLTYYFLDGDEKWLSALATYRQMFSESLERASSLNLAKGNREAIDTIAKKYHDYIAAKDKVVENYKRGIHPDTISVSHQKQRDAFFQLLSLCEEFSRKQWRDILQGMGE